MKSQSLHAAYSPPLSLLISTITAHRITGTHPHEPSTVSMRVSLFVKDFFHFTLEAVLRHSILTTKKLDRKQVKTFLAAGSS